MEQILVVRGNIYSVIRDENEIPTRVSRLKNNLTDLGRFLFGAWMVKHANYYINGGDTTGYVSGVVIGKEGNQILVLIPQVSAIVLATGVSTMVYSSSVTDFEAGHYSSSSTEYGSSYYSGSLGTGLVVSSVPSDSVVAWMGVYKAPSADDPTTHGVAHLNITRGTGSVTVTIKGYYSFSASANSNDLILTVDGRVISASSINPPSSVPTNILGNKSSWVIFRRTFSASFTNGQSIRVTWQVNISGS
jgi:hypothetical protein